MVCVFVRGGGVMKMTEARRRNLVRREKEVKLAECRPASAMRRAIEKYHEACRQPDAPFISSYGFLLEYAGLGRR